MDHFMHFTQFSKEALAHISKQAIGEPVKCRGEVCGIVDECEVIDGKTVITKMKITDVSLNLITGEAKAIGAR